MTSADQSYGNVPLKIRGVINDLLSIVTGTPNDQYIDISTAPLVSAKELYEFRRKREKLIDTEIFGEPCWDILLDLYDANRLGKAISVTSACIGASVPPTTALRWMNVLIQRGHIERHDDPTDARRSFLQLTPSTHAKMISLFGA